MSFVTQTIGEGYTPLTPEELNELEQCKKIIALRDQVFAGLHSTIKPLHLRTLFGMPGDNNELLSSCYEKHTISMTDIDFGVNYYRVMGLSGNPSKDDIEKRFFELGAAHNPHLETCADRIERLGEGDGRKRHSILQVAFKYWKAIHTAHFILADEKLKAEYDYHHSLPKTSTNTSNGDKGGDDEREEGEVEKETKERTAASKAQKTKKQKGRRQKRTGMRKQQGARSKKQKTESQGQPN